MTLSIISRDRDLKRTVDWINNHRSISHRANPSQESHRLLRRYFKPSATLRTGQHVVDPNHIVAKLAVHLPIFCVGPSWGPVLLQAADPSHLVLSTMPALGTGDGSRFQLFLLVEKISFVT